MDFIPATTGSITGSVVLTDNNLNASPSTTQSIGLSGAGATPIMPYIQVNGGGWQQSSSVTVNAGDTVDLGEQVLSGGSYSWSGPPGFSNPATRIASAAPLNSATNVFTLTYTNTSGVNSTQTFTINVNSTPLTPYIQVNGGGWQQLSTVTVNAGDTVNLGRAGSQRRQLQLERTLRVRRPGNADRLRCSSQLSSNVFTLTYTNTSGVTSTQTFTITSTALRSLLISR